MYPFTVPERQRRKPKAFNVGKAYECFKIVSRNNEYHANFTPGKGYICVRVDGFKVCLVDDQFCVIPVADLLDPWDCFEELK
jgi:hypothetical protein